MNIFEKYYIINNFGLDNCTKKSPEIEIKIIFDYNNKLI